MAGTPGEYHVDRNLPDDGLPRRVGPCRIIDKLGRGGMGVVFRAFDDDLQCEVALKTVDPVLAAEQKYVHRLRHEATALARIGHPNIAQIYGTISEKGLFYIVMELVPGESLRSRLRSGPLPIPLTLEVSCAVANALLAAHRRGVIHRDLTPGNIQITLPDPSVAKVLDFGLAKVNMPAPPAAGSTGGSTATASAASISHLSELRSGTPGYMAPEQVRGRAAEPRSDLFSFGCVLFECLAGSPAFSGGDFFERYLAVIEDEPDWNAIPRDTPEPVRRLLSSCLQKIPADRPAHAGIVRDALQSAITDSPSRAAPAQALSPPPAVRPRTRIPRPLGSLVGFEHEIERLVSLLTERQLMTLTGAGGVGKSRLAHELAYRSAGTFPGGVIIAELHRVRSSAEVLAAISVAAELRAAHADHAGIADRFQEHRTLLVLDGCEHVLEPVARLCVYLLERCEQAVVLATSQEMLGLPGETVFPVSALPVPGLEAELSSEVLQYASVKLFMERARAVNSSFELTYRNAGAIGRICRRLGGLPFAIELAASLVATLPAETIDRQLDGSRFDLLPAGNPSLPEHKRTLRGTIAWSYNLLDDDEKRLLRLFASISCDLSYASALKRLGVHMPSEKISRVLDALVKKSLLTRTAARTGNEFWFHMSESIQAYLLHEMKLIGEWPELKNAGRNADRAPR